MRPRSLAAALGAGLTAILAAGAMRQWGRQATAFVGRRHFDDTDLFEKRFILDLR